MAFPNGWRPMPPLDRDFIECLSLFGHQLCPNHYQAVLGLAREEFGTYRGVGLEQLLTRMEAFSLNMRLYAEAGTDDHQQLINDGLLREFREKTACARSAVVEVLSRLTTQTIEGDIGTLAERSRHGSWHTRLAAQCQDGDTIASFNYDTMIDHSIKWERPWLWAPEGGTYGQPVLFSPNGRWVRRKDVQRGLVEILKLHGSIHFCSSDRGPQLVEDPVQNPDPLIIPPVFGKPIEEWAFLSQVWRRAAGRISETTALVVVGYSAPTADQRAQALLGAKGKPLEFILILNPSREDANHVLSLFSRRIQADTIIAIRPGLEDLFEFV